jgi:hypothetical protein
MSLRFTLLEVLIMISLKLKGRDPGNYTLKKEKIIQSRNQIS